MRTTLNIDDDLLQLAREMAARERTTVGAVVSRLARQGYGTSPPGASAVRNGVEMLPRRGEPVTLAHIQRLMDEEGI